jgi:5'-3' exonuclease
MGVRGLMSYCKPIRKVANTNNPQRIGIDAFSLIFLFRERREDFRAYLLSLSKHELTFVMDKRAQKEKKETVDERKQVRSDAKQEASEITTFTQTDQFDGLDEQQRKVLEKYLELKRRDAWCLYPEYVKWLKQMVTDLGITIIIAKEEADTVLAKGYDVVITSDSDLLLHGATIWIPNTHDEINHEDFMNHMGLTQEQLYEMAFLSGCDVQPKKFMDIDAAVSLLRFYGSLEAIQKKRNLLSEAELELWYKLKKIWT